VAQVYGCSFHQDLRYKDRFERLGTSALIDQQTQDTIAAGKKTDQNSWGLLSVIGGMFPSTTLACHIRGRAGPTNEEVLLHLCATLDRPTNDTAEILRDQQEIQLLIEAERDGCARTVIPRHWCPLAESISER
jgi:hypothetical protein